MLNDYYIRQRTSDTLSKEESPREIEVEMKMTR